MPSPMLPGSISPAPILVLFPPARGFIGPRTAEVPVRLRALRKIAEETKNHDLERDLYIEERKAERGVYLRQLLEDLKKEGWNNWPRNAGRLITRPLWIVVMCIYWALADYGRSFVRPLAALIASVFFFDWRYTEILAPLMAKATDVDKYKQALRMLALGNAVPFVGPLTIDTKIKEFLFCPARQLLMPAHPAGRLSIPGDLPKPLFDHLRVFHRPRVAQLFQDQVSAVSAIAFQPERRLHPVRIAVDVIAQLQLA